MSDWEDKLPPIMRERLARLGSVTPEEKQRLKAAEELNTLLSGFYKGEVDPDGLWKRLKEAKEAGKGYLLKEAQLQLVNSLNVNVNGPELQRRKKGILAVESLKQQPSTSSIEQGLSAIDALLARNKKEVQQAYDHFKVEIERNPQLRMQQVKQGQQTMVVQLSVDEAIRVRPEWKNFVAEHDERFNQEFDSVMERIRRLLK